jgi:dTDP-4-dehydrorhamnose reductase
VDRAETDREAAHAANAIGPGVLAEEAARCGALLMHFSTDYVYDGAKPSPYLESDPVNPLSVYGATKLDGERAVAASGAAHLVLRTSWVYGARGRNFLFTMLRLGRERPELRIVDDQLGAPTSSRALARLVRELLEGPGSSAGATRADVDRAAARGGIYHATAAGETTWFGFAQAIFEEALRQGRLDFEPPRLLPIATRDYPTPARRPANSVLSNEKLGAAFGVTIPDWRGGLEEVVSALPG